MHGTGKYTYTNGDTYVGPYVDDLKHGPGVYTWAEDGSTMNGVWENGECVSRS